MVRYIAAVVIIGAVVGVVANMLHNAPSPYSEAASTTPKVHSDKTRASVVLDLAGASCGEITGTMRMPKPGEADILVQCSNGRQYVVVNHPNGSSLACINSLTKLPESCR